MPSACSPEGVNSPFRLFAGMYRVGEHCKRGAKIGNISFRRSTRFAATSFDMKVLPVKLPSGRARLLTIPRSMGSPLSGKQHGNPSVTFLIARIAGPLDTARSMFWGFDLGYDGRVSVCRVTRGRAKLDGVVSALQKIQRAGGLRETLL